MGLRIGVDIGGTKIEAIALDGAREVFRKRVPTPRGDYDATIAAVASLVREMGEGSVGVGIPGALSRVTGWSRTPTRPGSSASRCKQDLESASTRGQAGERCQLLRAVRGGRRRREGGRGGVRRHPRHRRRRRHRGARQGAAGAERDCGRVGPQPAAGADGGGSAAAVLLLRPGRLHRDLPVRARASRATTRSSPGESLAAEEIVALQGESLRRYEERLARALASVINVLDPDVIVLGGGMSNVGRLYTEVPRLWSRYVFSDHVATRLARNAHGDSSGVRGAAWLWDLIRGGDMKYSLSALTARRCRAGAIAGPEKVKFPTDYLKGELYQTLDRADVKQYRELYTHARGRRGGAQGQADPERRGPHAGAVERPAGREGRAAEGRRRPLHQEGHPRPHGDGEARGLGRRLSGHPRNGEWEYQAFNPDGLPNPKAKQQQAASPATCRTPSRTS